MLLHRRKTEGSNRTSRWFKPDTRLTIIGVPVLIVMIFSLVYLQLKGSAGASGQPAHVTGSTPTAAPADTIQPLTVQPQATATPVPATQAVPTGTPAGASVTPSKSGTPAVTPTTVSSTTKQNDPTLSETTPTGIDQAHTDHLRKLESLLPINLKL